MPHSKTLVRTRLAAHGRGVLDARLTLVVAPPGSGKSVLLAHWLDDLRAQADVLGMCFKPEHDSPSLFRKAVADSVSTLLPSLKWDADQDFDPGDLGTLIEAVHERASSRPLVIALDGFESLVDPSIVAAIATAMALLPHHVHFIIASRTAPTMLLSEWRAHGEVVDLAARDLAFTREEMRDLAALRGDSIDDAQLDLVAENTAGWPVAVNLAFAGRPSSRALGEYIDDVVLAGLPSEEREFLEEVAVLAAVTSEAADQVRATTDSGERIKALERLGRFPAGGFDDHGAVHLPPVLREHLRNRIGSRQPRRLAVLRSRAAAQSGAITSLSTRELEILALLATGLTAEGIADELVLSFHTVKAHMRSIYSKLGVSTRMMAVMRATELGLVAA